MEPNGLPGGMYSSMGSGMLGLEMSLNHHHHPQPRTSQNLQNPNFLLQNPHNQMVGFSLHEPDHTTHTHQQPYQQPPKSKPQHLTLSDEDGEDSVGGDGKKKDSPWQRMKWTDGMVRLLVMVVFYIGDEAVSEGGGDPVGKKKCSGGGVLQKKGKWKSVSRALMERGFSVSPQQCEDKFNDLNKRYKRVNDILGKGTACKVVENQSLLDTMDHLSPKMKEEVKKLLNSKHLFFREMCAYHNSCGGGGGSGGGANNGNPPHAPESGAERSQIQQQEMCFHASENPAIVPNSGIIMGMEGSKFPKEYDHDDEDEDDDDDEELGYENGGGSSMRSHEDDEGSDGKCSRKRHRMGVSSPLIQQLSSELIKMSEDATRSHMEKRQWIKNRLLQLEEERIGHQVEAYEIEKQRLKWLKFSTKKEREMEREKLKNERVKLENDRMMLLLRKKEFELLCTIIEQQQGQLPPN